MTRRRKKLTDSDPEGNVATMQYVNQFPHAAIEPHETVPRITPDHARQVIEAIETRPDLYPAGAAIIIAVWQKAIVKYLIDDQQVRETLRRFEKKPGAGK